MLRLFQVFAPPELRGEDLEDIIRSGQLTSGARVRELEEAIGKYLGNPLVLVTANNSLASMIALAAIGVGPGDEVITTPMACLASNQPILTARATPVWTDVDPATGTLDPEDVKRRITLRTKAIVHYHWCGYPGHVDEINAIGREYGIPVIEDGIESFGALAGSTPIGATGCEITTFSLQTVRLPHCVDGGALTFRTRERYQIARRMRDFGIDRPSFRDTFGEINPASDIPVLGFNAIMSELNAHIGLTVMRHVPSLLDRQRDNAARWDERLPREARPLSRPGTRPNYWVYTYRSPRRDAELAAWRDRGIYASKVHLRNDLYSCFGRAPYALPGVDAFAAEALALPSGWWVTPDKIPPKES